MEAEFLDRINRIYMIFEKRKVLLPSVVFALPVLPALSEVEGSGVEGSGVEGSEARPSRSVPLGFSDIRPRTSDLGHLTFAPQPPSKCEVEFE